MYTDPSDPSVHSTGMFNNFYLKVGSWNLYPIWCLAYHWNVFKIKDNEPVAYQNDNSGWKVLIHDSADSPLIEIRTHGTTLYRGWSKDSNIYVRQV